MDFVSFLIGLLIGLIIALIVWFLMRRRTAAANAALADAQRRLEADRAGHKAALDQSNSRLRAAQADMETAAADCQAQVAALEAQLGAAQAEAESLRAQSAAADVDLGATRSGGMVAGFAAEAESQGPDDLTLIEGIGPKINQLLHAAGIGTFRQLSMASVDRLNAILAEAGPRFRLADPGSWADQARLAAAGAMEELQALQDRLKGGRS